MTDRSSGPLAGIRVVDITQEIAGPLAARILAEMGADVIHVEPLRGDNGRNSTTRYLGTEGMFHVVCNRSKRSLALDTGSPQGVEVLQRLIGSADVLIDGTTPGTLERLGFSYAQLAAQNPMLVYGALTGYGRRGPLGNKRGYDVLVQSLCGVLAPPQKGKQRELLGYLYADTATPLMLVNGILAALFARDRTGRGQYVETSLLQGAIHMLGPALLSVDDDPDMQAWVDAAVRAELPQEPGEVRDSAGATRAGDPTTQIFEAGDGKLFMLAAWTDAQFRILCDVLGLEQIGSDDAYATRLARAAHGEDLRDLIGACLLTRTAAEWIEVLGAAGIPCGAVHLNPLALGQEDHLWESDMLLRLQHPSKGMMTQPGVGILFGDTPMQVTGPAPRLGEHTEEILTELGYASEQTSELVRAGVVTCASVAA